MTITANKVLLELSKIEAFDGINYKRWPQKLMNFFEQLEVDYVLFSNIAKESNTADSIVRSFTGSNREKSNIVDEKTMRTFKKDNKQLRDMW